MKNTKKSVIVTLALWLSSFSLQAETDSERLGRKACEFNGVHKQDAVPVDSEVLDRYNWLAHGLIEGGLDNGFILGFEKLKPSDRTAYTNLQSNHLGRYTPLNAGYVDQHKVRNKLLERRLDDGNPLVLTHVLEYKDGGNVPLYNAYTRGDGTFYLKSSELDRNMSNSLHALTDVLVPKLESRLASGDYTHVIFISMGWNNDQGVSICRMSALIEHAEAQLQEKFKPLVIGITWPSVVFGAAKFKVVRKVGHIGSVFNKANDGDEMGVFFGNLILNRLIPLANTGNLPVVVVGHSYGGRIVGRATYSRELLTKGAIGDGPDLLVLLQPAFSARRFVAGDQRGREGAPFAPIAGTRTITIGTTSDKDLANPVAVWSAHFGGFQGRKYVQLSDSAQRVFDYISEKPLADAVEHAKAAVAGRPMMVDASQFVGNHNDIYGPLMGKFVAGLIAIHAPAQTN